MSTKLIKIGVFGAGHLGKIHLKLLNESKKFNLLGFHDVNPDYSIKIEKEFGYKYFEDSNLLIESSDAIAIISPMLITNVKFTVGFIKLQQTKLINIIVCMVIIQPRL